MELFELPKEIPITCTSAEGTSPSAWALILLEFYYKNFLGLLCHAAAAGNRLNNQASRIQLCNAFRSLTFFFRKPQLFTSVG